MLLYHSNFVILARTLQRYIGEKGFPNNAIKTKNPLTFNKLVG